MPSLGSVFRTYVDASGETSTVTAHVELYDGDNIVTQNTAVNALWSAIDGISIMEAEGYGWGNRYSMVPIAISSKFAQRETKWLVLFHDAVTNDSYKMEIPGADLALTGEDGATLPLDTGPGATFKAAFEAVVLSKSGNATVVDRVYHVGRNI